MSAYRDSIQQFNIKLKMLTQWQRQSDPIKVILFVKFTGC